MGQKQGFFNLLKIWSLIFTEFVYNEDLCYLLCSCTNPIFWKDLVPEILAKMLSASQIAGFLNQLFLQNKLMKQSHFLHLDTNSQKLKVDQKVFVKAWSEMGMANLVSGL